MAIAMRLFRTPATLGSGRRRPPEPRTGVVNREESSVRERHWLEWCEYLAIAATASGAIAAALQQQVLYAATPATLALGLGAANRWRLEQQLQAAVAAQQAQWHQQLEPLAQQQFALTKAVGQLSPEASRRFEHLEAAWKQVRQDLAPLQDGQTHLRADLTAATTSTQQLQTQLERLQARWEQLQQQGRDLRQQFDQLEARTEAGRGQLLDAWQGSLGQVREQLETLRAQVEHGPQPVDAEARRQLAQIQAQLGANPPVAAAPPSAPDLLPALRQALWAELQGPLADLQAAVVALQAQEAEAPTTPPPDPPAPVSPPAEPSEPALSPAAPPPVPSAYRREAVTPPAPRPPASDPEPAPPPELTETPDSAASFAAVLAELGETAPEEDDWIADDVWEDSETEAEGAMAADAFAEDFADEFDDFAPARPGESGRFREELPAKARDLGETLGKNARELGGSLRTLWQRWGQGPPASSRSLWTLGPTLTGIGAITAIAWHPEGRWLAIATAASPEIQLWDATAGALVQTFRGHREPVQSLAFSPDGHWLASGGQDCQLKLWDIHRHQEAHTLEGHRYHLTTLAFSPQGDCLASGSEDKTLCLWDEPRGSLRATLTGHWDGLAALAFSPEGDRLASASRDGQLKLWGLPGGDPLASQAQGSPIGALAFSREGQNLVSVSRDGRVQHWSLPALLEHSSWRLLGRWGGLAVSPTAAAVAVGRGRSLEVRALASGQPLAELPAGGDRWSHVAWRADGGAIAAGGRTGQVQVWQAPVAEPPHE